MANKTCLKPVLFIQGDGVSTTAKIALKTTPLFFEDPTTILYNFPASVDSAAVVMARDSQNNDVTAQVSVSHNGYLLTIAFTAPFTDVVRIILSLQFDV